MVYYLKVNRENDYVIPALQHWVDATQLSENSVIYIVCDNGRLKKNIDTALRYDSRKVKFIKSYMDSEELDEILSEVTIGNWKRIGAAHLSTYLHARKNKIKEFWNIDADDTFICLNPKRINELLSIVEDYSRKNNMHMMGLDMWHSISISEAWCENSEWSLGITYVDNTVDWFEVLRKYSGDQEYQEYHKTAFNLDWYFTYLSSKQAVKIDSFAIKNMKFMHYYRDFFEFSYKGGFYFYKENTIEFPITKYCFGKDEKGEIPMAKDTIVFNLDVTKEETTNALDLHCAERETFSQYMDSIAAYDQTTIHNMFSNYMKENKYNNIVFYGAGNNLKKNYGLLRLLTDDYYICDKNPEKQGMEFFNGKKCISVSDAQKLSDALFVVTVESDIIYKEIADMLDTLSINRYTRIDTLLEIFFKN